MTSPSKKAKDRMSGWLLTINTNQRFGSVEEARPFMLGLQAAMRGVLERPRDFVKFSAAARARGDTWRPDVILSAKAKQGVEFSGDNHLVHVHAVLQLRHRSTIQLDYGLIKRTIQSQLVERFPQWMCYSNGEAKALYFNGKAFTPSQTLVDYVTKDAEYFDTNVRGQQPASQSGELPGSDRQDQEDRDPDHG